MTFKAGDKVRIIDAGMYGRLEVGDVGIVEDTHSSPGWFNVRGKTKLGKDFQNGMEVNDVRWELVKKRALKNPTHLVIWDEEGRDPHKFFTDEEKTKEFMKELSEKSGVKKDSIILVAIKSVQKVSITKMVRLAGYKI